MTAARVPWNPRKLSEQTVVITGGASGIGLATAQLAAAQGARVVINGRNEHDLRRAVDGIQAGGGQAFYVLGNVADEEAMAGVGELAVREFGRIDTWFNAAGLSMDWRLMDVPTVDARRVFDANFWGVVNGCRAAVPHLRARGGVIINLGSIANDMAIPFQEIYCASKHAVKGYTDALRLELQREGTPIAVTLVKPAALDLPDVRPEGSRPPVERVEPASMCTADEVARAILHCAERPASEIVIGGGRALALMGTVAPRLADLYRLRTFSGQRPSSARAGGSETAEPSSPE